VTSALLCLRHARAKAPHGGQTSAGELSDFARKPRRRTDGNKLSPGYLLGTARSVAV
jgi:hypothetical protein